MKNLLWCAILGETIAERKRIMPNKHDDPGSLHSKDHLVTRAEVEHIARSASNFMREVYTSLTCRMSTYDYLGLYHDDDCDHTTPPQNYAGLIPFQHIEEYGEKYYNPILSESHKGKQYMWRTDPYLNHIKKAEIEKHTRLNREWDESSWSESNWVEKGVLRCPVQDRENKRFQTIKLFSQSSRHTSRLTRPLREMHDMIAEHQPCFRGDLNTQDMHAKLNMNAAVALWTEIFDGNALLPTMKSLQSVSLPERFERYAKMMKWILPEYSVFIMATMYDAGSIEDGAFRPETPLIWQRELVLQRFSEMLIERAGILRRLMNTSEKYHSMKRRTMKLRTR